jgi:hypothetical protein
MYTDSLYKLCTGDEAVQKSLKISHNALQEHSSLTRISAKITDAKRVVVSAVVVVLLKRKLCPILFITSCTVIHSLSLRNLSNTCLINVVSA